MILKPSAIRCLVLVSRLVCSKASGESRIFQGPLTSKGGAATYYYSPQGKVMFSEASVILSGGDRKTHRDPTLWKICLCRSTTESCSVMSLKSLIMSWVEKSMTFEAIFHAKFFEISRKMSFIMSLMTNVIWGYSHYISQDVSRTALLQVSHLAYGEAVALLMSIISLMLSIMLLMSLIMLLMQWIM